MTTLIDLSGYVEENQPVFGGNTRTHFWIESTHEEVGHRAKVESDTISETTKRHLRAEQEGVEHPQIRTIVVNEHGPTHVDALSHIDPTLDETIDEMDLSWFYGDAIGIDVSEVPFEEFITKTDIQSELEEYGLSIQDGDAITIHTGHRQTHYGLSVEKRHQYVSKYNGLDKEAAVWLAEEGIKNIGIDSPSIDHSKALETNEFHAHDTCADYEMINMENMANLDKVAGKRYTLAAFPLKLREGTGSPIRPVAILE